ncbi:GNAT family N-acetyltransferase [Stieleria sp. JC731]|uniref:GNAT family N-acetyltransferase n=1 Tax=Pirellulaceae TaxID=2691357 RepID=UPI001E4C529C|nr:GNAT family N-acetyltransferase [Stieleria sp. JC731]MCC9600510.1 GNAT family N-acetyltransferase [Stieleria sp. JC731]
MALRIELIDNLACLSDDLIDQVNQLATHPLQRWEWMGSWLECFASTYQPFILVLYNEDQVIGIAPWCLERRPCGGRTLVFIGSGKACSDHLSLLVRPENASTFGQMIAQWLINPLHRTLWDTMELIGADEADKTIAKLTGAMRDSQLEVETSAGDPCYAVDLPATWEDYVQRRSKSGRREIRQSLKSIDDGTIDLVRITSVSELDRHWSDFIELHRKRRDDAGTSNCFDFPNFETFLRTASARLLDAGYLQFLIAFAEGKPICAHFAVADADGWYFYQSGMDPEMSHLRPGLSVFCHTIRESIQAGRTKFDMMRGDEPYKLRWRAEVVPTTVIRSYSPTGRARVRQQFLKTGVTFKNLMKHSFGVGTPRS